VTKISALAALTAGPNPLVAPSLNLGDLVPVVDVTDTTMAPSGTDKALTLGELIRYIVPPGMESPYAGPAKATPPGWLYEDGRAVSRTTYANLFNVLCFNLGAATVTVASPGVVTCNGHMLQNGDGLYFTTTGTLPTGLSPNTWYYATAVTANTFQVAASRTTGIGEGNAATLTPGAAINTTAAGTGTHTVFACPWGLGDGSTTFNVPDRRGSVPMGADSIGGSALRGVIPTYCPPALGSLVGEIYHTNTVNETPWHGHASYPGVAGFVYSGAQNNAGLGIQPGGWVVNATQGTGGSWAHNNLQPCTQTAWIVKT
jgi:microcystin-dependent protein